MRKGLAFVSVGLTVSVVLLAVAACEDSKSSEFPSGGDDASFDTGPGFRLDGSPDGKEPIVCNPSLPTQFKGEWKPPTKKQGACTQEDLAGYYDNCLPDPSQQKCTDWIAAHQACADCIAPEDKTGPIQHHLHDPPFYGLNQGGCVALVQNALGEDQCGAAFEIASQCRRLSCDDCLTRGGEFGNGPNECNVPDQQEKPTTFICCQVKAANTGCKRFEDEQDRVCVGYRDPDGGAPQCFRMNNEPDRELYLRVMGIFCGP